MNSSFSFIYTSFLFLGALALVFVYAKLPGHNILLSQQSEENFQPWGSVPKTAFTKEDVREKLNPPPQVLGVSRKVQRINNAEEKSSTPQNIKAKTIISSSELGDLDTGKTLNKEERAYLYASKNAIWPESDIRPGTNNTKLKLYPKLVPICACESSYHGTWWDEPRQFENGEVLRNYGGSDDVGMCQISLTYNKAQADIFGWDLETRKGNMRYSNWLFERKGSAPWYKSRHCWKDAFNNDGSLKE